MEISAPSRLKRLTATLTLIASLSCCAAVASAAKLRPAHASSRVPASMPRALRISSAVLTPVSGMRFGTGKIKVSATDPTHGRDRLLVYLTRRSCYRTYLTAAKYVSSGGYEAQVTDGPPVPADGSMTYDFSVPVGTYRTVCAMLYRAVTPVNASGAPLAAGQHTLKTRYTIFRTASKRLGAGKPLKKPCSGYYC